MIQIQQLSKNSILLCSPALWPKDIRELLLQEDQLISNFFHRRKEIDELAREDVILRVHRPNNKFIGAFHQTAAELRKFIDQYKFISFHCTRLTIQEQTNISDHGLVPLSPDLARTRIQQLRNQNNVSSDVLDILKNENKAGDSNRAGLLWFFHCPEQLKDAWGVFRLLSTWGGEALYVCHEGSDEILDQLRNIGEPCIVIAFLTAEDISAFGEIEGRMLEIWHNRKGEITWLDPDTPVKKPIKVEGIIRFSDPLFETLTQSSRWRDKLA